jgi:hypothetical protein
VTFDAGSVVAVAAALAAAAVAPQIANVARVVNAHCRILRFILAPLASSVFSRRQSAQAAGCSALD